MAAPLHSHSVRDRILDAVGRLVMEVGAGRLTLEQVAQSAGVSKGGLLYHFPSKEALLLGMAQRFIQVLEAARQEAREQLPDESAAALKAGVLGVLCSSQDRRCQGAAILAAAANDPGLVHFFRDSIARFNAELAQSPGLFERKAIVSLAVDGLMLREALNVSTFSTQQRATIVEELLRLADESCTSESLSVKESP